MSERKKQLVPLVGGIIYVPSALYISRGEDDVCGGKATVTEVKEEIHGNRKVHMVRVKELPRKGYYWENGLMQDQEKLKERFGDNFAYPDPDEREEFNAHSIITHDVIRRWLKEGQERGATHVIVISDTYDYTYYPVHVMPGEDPREIAKQEGSAKEVYSLSRDIELQLSEGSAMHYD
jgi:hypothetical protein